MNAKHLFIFLAALMFATSVQAQTTDTKDVQIAKRKLRVGMDTSLYVTSTADTITAGSTHREMPTAKAVYDYGLLSGGDDISEFISTGLGNPPAAAASDNDGETWRNMTTGELWRSDGSDWILHLSGTGDKGDIRVNTALEYVIDTGAVGTVEILDSSITAQDFSQMGASYGQVMKWNGSDWGPAADSSSNSLYTGSGNVPAGTTATLAGQLTFDDAGANVMRFGDVGNLNGGYGITIDGSNGSVTIGNNYAGADAYIISSGDANYIRTDASNLQQTSSSTLWNILSGSFKFTDDRATKTGIEYNADYSATYTSRSLVDKAYVDNTDGNGIYGGDGSIPTGTQATLVNNGFFAFEWNGGSDAISIDDFGEQMLFISPNGTQSIQFNNAGVELNGGGTILNVSANEAKLAGETIIYTVPGPTIDPDAVLDIQSTTKLLYPPRMTTTDRNAISTAGVNDGGLLYNTSTGQFEGRAGAAWVGLGSGAGDDWGTQVVEHGSTLTGTGVTGNLLDVADNGISNAKMADNAIGNAEMADNAIGNAEMADNAVGTAEIVNGAVTLAKLDETGASNGSIIKHNGTDWVLGTDNAGGGGSLSGLTAATAGNTIDNLNFEQVWNWSTADTESPFTSNANALTTGSMFTLATASNALNSTNGLLNLVNTGSSSSGMFARFKANTTSGGGMFLLANGRVGIGTESPTTTFVVSNNNTVSLAPANALIHAVGGSSTTTMILGDAHSGGTGGAIFQGRHARGSTTSPTQVLNGDVLADFTGAGYHSGAAFSNAVAYMRTRANQDFTGAAQGTNIGFFTTPDGSTTPAERLTIRADGGVSLPGVTSSGALYTDANGTITNSKVTITVPATAATLTLANNSTLATSGANSVTLTSTGATNVTLPTTGTLGTLAGAEVLTNKEIQPRVGTVASDASPDPLEGSHDFFTVTALATGATFSDPGDGVDGQTLTIRILDNGTARSLAWNAAYRAGTEIPLPTTTTINKTMYVTFVYNVAADKWDLVGRVTDL